VKVLRVSETAARPEPEVVLRPEFDVPLTEETLETAARERTVARARLLWDERRFLFRIAAIGFAASTIIAFLIPSRFTSTVRLMPPDQQSGSAMAMMAAMSGKLGSLGGFGADLLGIKTPGELFVGVLQSRTVQERLISQFDLQKVYRDRYSEDARKDLAEHTGIFEDRKSGILTIQVTDRNPQRAAAMAQKYTTELNELMNQLTTSSASRERAFLGERLGQVKAELEAAERDFSQFASQNTAINIPEQGKAMVQAAATLEGQLIAAESELEGLRQIYTSNNVRVRSLEARVSELRRQLDKMGGEADAAGASGSQSLYPSIRKLPLLGVAYADLYRKTKIEEAVFETLTQQYELARVEEAKAIPVVKVLDAADVPHRKTYPPRSLIILLGTGLGWGAAVIGLFGIKAWTGIDPNDPRRVFAGEVLSTVRGQMPAFTKKGSRVRLVHGRLWSWVQGRQNGSGGSE